MSVEGFSKHYLLKNASITAALSGAGAASGLILDAFILGTFGVGHQTDALFTALTIPLLISSVFSVQSPKILVPIFTAHLSRNDLADAWRLLSNLLTTGFLVLVGICSAGMALSAVIMPLQIPGLDSNAISLAVSLSRVLFWLVLCQGLASIMQAMLYALHCYLISSSGKLISNSVTIIALVLGHNHFGIQAVTTGMLLGGLVQVAVLALALSTHGVQYRLVLRPTDPNLSEIVKSFRYPLAEHVLGEAGMILQNFLGSFLGSGSLTVIRYASRIVQSIAGVLLSSIVQVTLPLVSSHSTANDLRAQRKALLESIKLLSIVGLPICIWLIFTAEPMLVLLFARGAFSRADAALTSVIVRLLVPALLLGRLVSLAQTLFYANRDMRTPLISTLIFTVWHTVLAVLLVGLLGVLGLPLAVSLAALSNTIYMIAKLQTRFGPIGWSEMWGFGFRLSATCTMAAVGFILGIWSATIPTVSHSVAKLLDFAMPTGAGLCSFMTGAFLFRLIDIRLLLGDASPSAFLGRSS